MQGKQERGNRRRRRRSSKASIETERERERKDGGCRMRGGSTREGEFMRGLFSLAGFFR